MKLKDALIQLGDTEDKISAKLRSLGIKGFPRMAGACPIAKYLDHLGFDNPSVGAHDAACFGAGSEFLPMVIRKWITKFDHNGYPEFQIGGAW